MQHLNLGSHVCLHLSVIEVHAVEIEVMLFAGFHLLSKAICKL